MENNVQRNGCVDLLRIVCVFLIVIGHVYTFADFNSLIHSNEEHFVADVLKTFGLIEVNTFFVITGMYSKKSSFKKVLNKVFDLWKQMLLISLLGLMIFGFINIKNLTVDLILVSVLPFSMNGYWFVSAYIVLLILTPAIDKVFNDFDNKYILFCYALLGGLMVIIPSVFKSEKIVFGGEYSISFACFMYITGKLLVQFSERLRKKSCLAIFWLVFIAISVHKYLLLLHPENVLLEIPIRLYTGANSILAVLLTTSLSLFCYKSTLIIKNGFICNGIHRIAKASLSIYMLHCNKFVIRFLFPKLKDLWCWTGLEGINAFVISSAIFIFFLLLMVHIFFLDKLYACFLPRACLKNK